VTGAVWDSRHNFQPFRDHWYPLGLADPAAMHQVLANAAIQMVGLRRDTQDTEKSLSYHVAAIHSVNRRLADASQSTSDGLLGAILGVSYTDRRDAWILANR
jgi:hypothetical protein